MSAMDDPDEIDNGPPRKKPPSGDDEDAVPQKRRRHDVEGEVDGPRTGEAQDGGDDRPIKKKKRKKRRAAKKGWTDRIPNLAMDERAKNTYICILAAFFIAAGSLAVFGGREMILSTRSNEKPVEISLADLLKRGRAGNPYLVIKAFNLSEKIVVDTGTDIYGTRVKRAWLPIVPSIERETNELAADSKPIVIIKCNGSSQEEIGRRCSQEQIRGMVLLTDMDQADASELKNCCPEVDTNSLIVFQLDKSPASSRKWLAMLVGAAVAGLIGLAMSVVLIVNMRRGQLE